LLQDVALHLTKCCIPLALVLGIAVSVNAYAKVWAPGEEVGQPLAAGNDSVFQVGEELTYNVSYAFIDLGQVRIKVVDKIQKEGKTLCRAMAYIDSYKGVPLVDLHTTYESSISESLYARWFQARLKVEDQQWRKFIYDFDYPSGNVYVEVGLEKSDTVERRDTLKVNTWYQDGLSLFFFARGMVNSTKGMTIPVIVNEKKASTFLNFKNEKQSQKIDAVDYPIDVVYFDGRADFVGIFGLTGDFEGWFSNDAAHVPVLAKMKVLIGNVRLELMKWNRPGWTPPRYFEKSGK
jgi:hypothetical protein